MIKKFFKEVSTSFVVANRMKETGLLSEYVRGVCSRNQSIKERDAYDDALRYIENMKIVSVGGENIPRTGGAMVVFNHPLGDILFPGMFEVVRLAKEVAGRDIKIVVGRSMLFHNKFGEAITPWVDDKITRFTGMFPKNGVDLSANGGGEVKTVSRRLIIVDGEILGLAPTGGVDGERYPQWGAGEIAVGVSEAGLPIIPVAMWERRDVVYVRIGVGFGVIGLTKETAADKMIQEIGKLLPPEEESVLLRRLNSNRVN